MVKVLVVEDNEFLLGSLVSFLKIKGCDVVTATTVSKALAMISVHSDLEVVLTDFHLEDRLGSEVVEVAKEQLPKVVVLVMSGEITLGDCPKLADGFLSKPFSSKELSKAIEDALAKKKAALVECSQQR